MQLTSDTQPRDHHAVRTAAGANVNVCIIKSFEYSRSLINIFTMAATKVVNGDEHTLQLRNAVSLTEYSAHPLPSLESVKPEYSVPPAYLMSDGYPDVGTPHSFSSLASNF